MKLYELVQARTIISNHIDQNQPLAASLAYKIMKLIKNTQNDYIALFNTLPQIAETERQSSNRN